MVACFPSFPFLSCSHLTKISKFKNNLWKSKPLLFYFSSEGELSDSVELRTLVVVNSKISVKYLSYSPAKWKALLRHRIRSIPSWVCPFTNKKFCLLGFFYTSIRLLAVIMRKILNTENQEILETFVMRWMLVCIRDWFWYCFQTWRPDLTSLTIALFKGKKSIQNWAQIKWQSHNKQWMVEAF